ncbi:hypothetical protein [Thiomonas arsenitoxydans]|uniref:hypothetical protein n=1 Tax=Thiomonas arsenitoxydans (strain DSM 22701 / CIP 110005 / 3As) TaxID=426114 RepID=UPI001ACC9D8C|nr:hypothetical protein [Thiomonas arsenitoxydans]MBN8775480.1 hypothetical protein [Thiomonas arsenitoxydans]
MADTRLSRPGRLLQLTVLGAALSALSLGAVLSLDTLAQAAEPAAKPASAPATQINLESASLTDLPGSPSRVRIDQSLGVHAIKQRDGFVELDNAVLLKTYVYAYSKQAVNYTGILTPNTEMIEPPAPVQASAKEKQQVDAMIAFDKAHPKLRIDVDDIALDAYVPQDKYYPIDNRLFIHGAGYYFDNSPYHYTYDHPEAFRHLACADAAVMKILDDAIANYQHFHMAIFATVLGGDAKTQGLLLRVDEVQLKDALGNVLIDQKTQ